MQYQKFNCVLKVLSPLHIGCDDVYEPTGFTLKRDTAKISVFDPFGFVSSLDSEGKAKLMEICSKGTVESIVELYQFIYGQQPLGREIPVCSGFPAHFRQILRVKGNKIENELNKLQLLRTAYRYSDNRPYIPGSAVKGALRTAYLNKLADEGKDLSSDLNRLKGKSKSDKPHEWLEEKLLGLDQLRNRGKKIEKDPFRMIKISDFNPVGLVPVKIMYAVNKKKKVSNEKTRGIPQILEVVGPGALFVGSITLEVPVSEKAVSKEISLKELFKSCNNFFLNEKRSEDATLKNIGAKTIEEPSNGEVLLRIGRHCGAEFVTIRRYRDIMINLGKRGKTFQSNATTLWLAAEDRRLEKSPLLLPFGWISIHELTPQLREEISKKELELKAGPGIVQIPDQEKEGSGKASDPKQSPEELRAERVANFSRLISQVQNLPGEINRLINMIRSTEELELQKELCNVLLASAKSLKKKKKYEKALEQGKKWALELKELCEELGVS